MLPLACGFRNSWIPAYTPNTAAAPTSTISAIANAHSRNPHAANNACSSHDGPVALLAGLKVRL